MLVWSGVAHVACVQLYGARHSFHWIVRALELHRESLGSYPLRPDLGKGSEVVERPAPAKKAEPEEPEDAEPKKRSLESSGPQRKIAISFRCRMLQRSRRKKKDPKPSSGLTGRDAASADSAQLKGIGVPGLGLGGEGGGGSAFDQDFEYSYYVQQMFASINQHWQQGAGTRPSRRRHSFHDLQGWSS